MLHPLSFKKLPVFLLFYFSVNVSYAQVYNTSVSAATGGTGRAAVQAGDANYMNAATLVHLRGRHFYSSFGKDEMALSFSDNTNESTMPAGIAYISEKKDLVGTEDKLEEHDFSLSLAEFAYKGFSVGVTGHYLEQKLPEDNYRQGNADLGMAFTPNGSWGFGLVVYNVLGAQKSVPEELRKKTTAGAGVNYIYQRLARFRLDVTSEKELMGGMESYLSRWFILRFGYLNDSEKQRQVASAGFGFDGPRFGVNYAYQGNVKESGDYRHSVDLQVPF
jgi:hypothetical protein